MGLPVGVVAVVAVAGHRECRHGNMKIGPQETLLNQVLDPLVCHDNILNGSKMLVELVEDHSVAWNVSGFIPFCKVANSDSGTPPAISAGICISPSISLAHCYPCQ
jgi:hypothetical protein